MFHSTFTDYKKILTNKTKCLTNKIHNIKEKHHNKSKFRLAKGNKSRLRPPPPPPKYETNQEST